ncbi:MAG: endonuclease III [Phycisphaerales bacterium]|nr:endonuclease III [Phycisphaerales bacterium]
MSDSGDLAFELPSVKAAEKQRAAEVLAALEKAYPDAHCELTHANPYELLVATILSAQSTDAGVNKVTPELFKRFPSPAAYVASTPEVIETYINRIGLFRNKARAIHAAMRDIVEKFGGQVPRTMEELLTLRGVARKTANVVLGNAYRINVGFVVDTHIERVSKRFGLVDHGASVAMTERRLMALFPRNHWCDASHVLIFHGRYSCKARGVNCNMNSICDAYGTACECRPGKVANKRVARKPVAKVTTKPIARAAKGKNLDGACRNERPTEPAIAARPPMTA